MPKNTDESNSAKKGTDAPYETSPQRTEIALKFGIFSLILIWLPVVGVGLAIIGLSLALSQTKKIITRKDGFSTVVYLRWPAVPPRLKTAIVVSIVGLFGPVLVLMGLGLIWL